MEHLYESSARGTWREVFLTGDYERYVKEGSGNGALLCIYGLCKGNLEGGGGVLYWGLQETYQERL